MKTVAVGSFIKDLGPKKRSLGVVRKIDTDTNMMLVMFPKIGRKEWLVAKDLGHYVVID